MRFKLEDIEKENFDKWHEEHLHLDTYLGAIGGMLSFKFTPTSIGTIVTVKCHVCKQTEDLTNYDQW